MKARIKFRKNGVMRFIGHLDVMRYFQKVMRRADIPIAFTKGLSPHMIMSFAQPLGIGATSDGEYLDIELAEPIDSKEAMDRMNRQMVEGMEVTSFVEIPEDKKSKGMTMVAAATYRIELLVSSASADEKRKIPENMQKAAGEFLAQPEIVVLKKTKRSEAETDIKPFIYNMKVSEDSIELFLATGSEQNLKPELVMQAFFSYLGCAEEAYPFHVHRLDVFGKREQEFLPLDAFGREIVIA